MRLDRDGAVRRVRLIGVDTAERDDAREEERFWAEMAARFAVHSLLNRRVELSYDWEREDRFGRTLAYVRTEGGEFVNERIIRRGFSPAFLSFRFRADYRKLFREAEADARAARRGRWGSGEFEAPDPGRAAAHLGEYGSVRFRCRRVEAGRRYYFLWTADGRFQVLVSRDIVWPKPASSHFPGREWIVTGVLERQDDLLKMYVVSARQLAAGD